MGKVGCCGLYWRAGKVKRQTPRVEKQPRTTKALCGRAALRRKAARLAENATAPPTLVDIDVIAQRAPCKAVAPSRAGTWRVAVAAGGARERLGDARSHHQNGFFGERDVKAARRAAALQRMPSA